MKNKINAEKRYGKIRFMTTRDFSSYGRFFLWLGLAFFLSTLPLSIVPSEKYFLSISLDYPLSIGGYIAMILSFIFMLIGILLIISYFKRKNNIKKGISYPEDTTKKEENDDEEDDEDDNPRPLKRPIKIN